MAHPASSDLIIVHRPRHSVPGVGKVFNSHSTAYPKFISQVIFSTTNSYLQFSLYVSTGLRWIFYLFPALAILPSFRVLNLSHCSRKVFVVLLSRPFLSSKEDYSDPCFCSKPKPQFLVLFTARRPTRSVWTLGNLTALHRLSTGRSQRKGMVFNFHPC